MLPPGANEPERLNHVLLQEGSAMRVPMSRCREDIMPSRIARQVNDSREAFRAGKTGAKLGNLQGVRRRAGSFKRVKMGFRCESHMAWCAVRHSFSSHAINAPRPRIRRLNHTRLEACELDSSSIITRCQTEKEVAARTPLDLGGSCREPGSLLAPGCFLRRGRSLPHPP